MMKYDGAEDALLNGFLFLFYPKNEWKCTNSSILKTFLHTDVEENATVCDFSWPRFYISLISPVSMQRSPGLEFISHPSCCYFHLFQLDHKILMQILNLVLTLNSQTFQIQKDIISVKFCFNQCLRCPFYKMW